MPRARALFLLLALIGLALSPSGAPGQVPEKGRLREVLPAEGLDKASVALFHEQSGLDPHYYLADETVLGLGKRTEAVFARYKAGMGEALLLVVAYPAEAEAERAYGRFGRDFFSRTFDPRSERTLEKLETGAYAAAVRVRSFLIVVLEAPDRASCDRLARSAEENTRSLKSPVAEGAGGVKVISIARLSRSDSPKTGEDPLIGGQQP